MAGVKSVHPFEPALRQMATVTSRAPSLGSIILAMSRASFTTDSSRSLSRASTTAARSAGGWPVVQAISL